MIMVRNQRWLITGALFTGVVLIAGISGCNLLYTHGDFIQPPHPQYSLIMEDVPEEGKSKVAVFFLQDFDVCDSSCFQAWNAQLRSYGFRKVYFGYSHHVHYFTEEIRTIRETCPDTKIVIVGNEWGSYAAYSLANKVDPGQIALLVTIQRGHHLAVCIKDKPFNVEEEYHLPEVPTAEKCKEPKEKHDYPMDEIGQLLLGKIGQVAKDAFLESNPEKTTKGEKKAKDDWDFLAPKDNKEKKKGQVIPPRVTMLRK
ncbi:MAG: hypothetical protein RL595_1577 [Planctomycetota bacterium]|jgi:hypothetical protein